MFVPRSAGSSNGRTADSGSAYLGSSPSPAALGVKIRLQCISQMQTFVKTEEDNESESNKDDRQ